MKALKRREWVAASVFIVVQHDTLIVNAIQPSEALGKYGS